MQSKNRRGVPSYAIAINNYTPIPTRGSDLAKEIREKRTVVAILAAYSREKVLSDDRRHQFLRTCTAIHPSRSATETHSMPSSAARAVTAGTSAARKPLITKSPPAESVAA